MSNFRYGGYLLIALGLINLRYNTGHSNNLQHSALIVIPGIVLLVATFIDATKKFLVTPVGKIVAVAVVIFGVILAGFSN